MSPVIPSQEYSNEYVHSSTQPILFCAITCQCISYLVYELLDLKEKYVGLDYICFLKLDFVGTSLVIPVVKTPCSQHEGYSLDSLVRELRSSMPQRGKK